MPKIKPVSTRRQDRNRYNLVKPYADDYNRQINNNLPCFCYPYACPDGIHVNLAVVPLGSVQPDFDYDHGRFYEHVYIDDDTDDASPINTGMILTAVWGQDEDDDYNLRLGHYYNPDHPGKPLDWTNLVEPKKKHLYKPITPGIVRAIDRRIRHIIKLFPAN